MKTISFVQVNFRVGPKEFNAFYLPYSIGVLWSYVRQSPIISENFELDNIVWRRDPVDEVAEKLKDSAVIGFSTYVWNKNYNYLLAKKIKELNPNAILIFGGPEVPVSKSTIFEIHPYMDIVVKLEGEIIFKNVLERLAEGKPLADVQGLILNQNGQAYDTGDAKRIEVLDDIPSPYLTGVFDKIIAENPDVEWNVTLETDRGCPYACTFCDWGSLTYNKVKKFKLERIFAELEWAGKIKSGYLSMTNANFGIFPERDNLIADKIIEVQKTYGYPKTFSTAWAKNQKREVVDIVKKLVDSPYGFNQGLTVSVQTMTDSVLEIIKRKNMDINRIEEVFAMCNQNNIPVYTETILGLPGETFETWQQNFWTLFNSGNHTGVTVFQLQLLENTEMNLLQRKVFQIESSKVTDYIDGCDPNDVIPEPIEIVVGTKDLPREVMLDAQVWTWYINTFHINGITTYIARFLKQYLDVQYSSFYDLFWSYLVEKDAWWKQEAMLTRRYFKNWGRYGFTKHPNIGNVEIKGNQIVHRTVMEIHRDNKYAYIFKQIELFLREQFHLDEDLLKQLIHFQSNQIIKYKDIKSYPLKVEYDYDFIGFLDFEQPLMNHVCYEFDFPEDKETSFDRFLDNIYFQRRRNYGKALIKKVDK